MFSTVLKAVKHFILLQCSITLHFSYGYIWKSFSTDSLDQLSSPFGKIISQDYRPSSALIFQLCR